VDGEEYIKALKLQLALEAVEGASQIYQNAIEHQLMALEEQKEYELALTDGTREQEAAIDAKYDKKKAELKRKAAIADKTAAIITTIINTVVSAMRAYADLGPIGGTIAAALIAALGAVSVATIASQPIPKFYKGTESAPGGLLEVGDRGRELVETRSGKLFMANQPTITSGLQGARIYSNPETERMIAGGKAGYDSIDLREVVQSNNRIEKAIKNKREFYYRADKKTITERKGKYYKTWMNANLGT